MDEILKMLLGLVLSAVIAGTIGAFFGTFGGLLYLWWRDRPRPLSEEDKRTLAALTKRPSIFTIFGAQHGQKQAPATATPPGCEFPRCACIRCCAADPLRRVPDRLPQGLSDVYPPAPEA